MNNSLPNAQCTTLTDLLWPQAVLRGTVLLMRYKEGSVCGLSAPFRLSCTCLVHLALLSQRCNIYFIGVRQSSKDAHSHTPKYTQAHSGAGISTEKIHETKTLMYTHSHTCSHKNMHTLSSTRAPYCALERPTSRSLSLLSSSTSSSQKHTLTVCQQLKSLRRKKVLLALFFLFCFAAIAERNSDSAVLCSWKPFPSAFPKSSQKLDLFSEISSYAQELMWFWQQVCVE